MRFHTNHSIHAVSFLRSEGVDRFGRKVGVALKSRAYHLATYWPILLHTYARIQTFAFFAATSLTC
jgi:hypothetical protein